MKTFKLQVIYLSGRTENHTYKSVDERRKAEELFKKMPTVLQTQKF